MNPTDNTLLRVQLEKTDDSGKQQKMQHAGRKGEKVGGKKHGAVRLQSYGVSEHPPAGSQGMAVALNGNMDQPLILGVEHPDHRPTGLAEGEGKIYDMWGNYLFKQQNKWTWKVGDSKIEMFADGTIVLTGNVHLGGPGGVKASKDGTVDSAGDVDTSNFATKVWVT